ncbi:MAG: hypothetical protein ACRD52_17645 [Candidatus Acidiferrales bacterium]
MNSSPQPPISRDAAARSAHAIPLWVRWASILWLIVWFPVYVRAWGAVNFLHLCDIAVILACAGLILENSLLLSSQAVSSLLIDFIWTLDAAWRLILGRHLVGGTEYLFDAHVALGVRLLSLFHIALPVILVWALFRTGYDRRGLALQSAIALIAMAASRWASAAANINYAFRDPFFHRAWGPAPLHIAVMFVVLAAGAYWPTHLALKRLFPQGR